MINILHISRTMGQGGAEKVVYQICKDIKEKDLNMYVASTGGYLSKKLEEQGIVNINIPDIDKKNPVLMLKTLIILYKTIKKYDISIVHSHHRMAAFYSIILNIFNRKFKRVYTAHNIFEDKKKLMRFSLKGSKIVAVGNSVKRNLEEFYKINTSQIELIYNSVEFPKSIEKPKD